MPVAENVANGFFLGYFSSYNINLDKLIINNIRPLYFLILVTSTKDI